MIACKGELIGWFMCFVLWDANLKLIMASRWPVVNIVLVWLRQPSSPLLELCAQFLSASNPLGINHQLVTTTEESGEFYWTFQSFAFAIRFRVLPWTCTILKLRQLNDRLTHIKTSIQCLQPTVSMNTFWYNTVTTDADLKEKIISNHSMSPKVIDCREGDCKRITLISDSTLFSIQPNKIQKDCAA